MPTFTFPPSLPVTPPISTMYSERDKVAKPVVPVNVDKNDVPDTCVRANPYKIYIDEISNLISKLTVNNRATKRCIIITGDLSINKKEIIQEAITQVGYKGIPYNVHDMNSGKELIKMMNDKKLSAFNVMDQLMNKKSNKIIVIDGVNSIGADKTFIGALN